MTARRPALPTPPAPLLPRLVMVMLPSAQATLRERGPHPWSRWDEGTELAAGSPDAVRAAANLLAPGAWVLVTCITPNGRIDSHGGRITITPGPGGETRCAFCQEKL